jgi:hypothetical protein
MMSVSLAKFFLPLALLVWLALTGALFVWHAGMVGVRWLIPWGLSKAWAWINPSGGFPWDGGTANVTQVASYLSDQFGPALVSSLLWSGVLTGVGVIGFLLWVRRPEAEETHVRGIEISTAKALSKRTGGGGISVAGVTLDPGREHSHFLVTGSSGSGKSTVIRGILRQIQDRKEPAVVVDVEGEFVSQFYDERRGDTILNPLDSRFLGWSPWSEIDAPGDGEQVAAAFLPSTPTEKSNANATYFNSAGRSLIVALLDRITDKRPQTIVRVLNGNPAILVKGLAGTPAAAHLGSAYGNQRGGVISSAQLACECLKFLPPLTGPGWSAREWAQHRRGWIFLTTPPAQSVALLPLLSAWLDLLIGRLLAADRQNERTTWVVIDELAALSRQQNLETLLTRGRKRGLAVVLGFQSMSQLKSLYGWNGAATLLASPSVKLLLAAGESEVAKWSSDQVGEVELERAQHTESAGAWAGSDRQVRARVRRRDPAILSTEFQHLPNYQGFCVVRGVGVAQVKVDYDPAEQHVPAFVPRPVPTMPPPSPVIVLEQKKRRSV